MPYSSCHNFAPVAPYWACSIPNCSPRWVHHFISLHHFHLSSSCSPKCCWKRAMWFKFQILIRTCTFVIFAIIDVCILWTWALHMFWTMPCLTYRGVYHVFLWSMWWLAQACKLGLVMLLILVPVLLLFWCHVNWLLQRYPCIFWDTSVRVFWTYGYPLSIHAPVCN